MANPTTNFGWVMPTSTSLVTNLPADFNTFGQAVDNSMQYLLGGTTGQVLSKTSGTNMAFTWVTPTDQTPLTTKGDLFTFSTVDARLAVGNNGETLVADSSASTGLRYSSANQQNPVINSAMQVWQRGTSISLAASAGYTYTADRWCTVTGTNQAVTVSRQLTNDTTNLPNIQYCMRYQRNSGQTGTGTLYNFNVFESINSIPYAGKTVTISFYARAGANYSATSNALSATINIGTGTDQQFFSFTGGTTMSGITPNAGVATLTTTWQRFSFTGSIGGTYTQLAAFFNCTPTGTAGANDYYEVTGVQIDIGSVALPFRTNGATIQGELAACQRYYYREVSGSTYATFQQYGIASTTTNIVATLKLPVTMRTNPTGTVDFSSLRAIAQQISVYNAITAVTLDTSATTPTNAYFNMTTTGLTALAIAGYSANNSTTAFVGVSAEL